MSGLPERDYVYYTTVNGMCRDCGELVPSRVVFRGDEVWQEKICPVCGSDSALIAGDRKWYLDRMAEARVDRSPIAPALKNQARKGCPHDCGPCPFHGSDCQLPVFSITNACNLRCPICFTYNRKDKIWFMPVEEMRQTVDWIIRATGKCDLINITGGEPTLHPDIFGIIEAAKRPEIGRITMNSNGIRMAEDMAFCERLAQLGVYVVLSLNTLDGETSMRLHGKDLVDTKLKAIENLTNAGVSMTLLNVLIRDTNENMPGQLMEMMRENQKITNLVIQTMTYTGQGGGTYKRGKHIPVDVAANMLCESMDGEIKPSDFVSRPSAHPLCYSLCYLFKPGDRFLPFTRVLSPSEIHNRLADSYLMDVEDDSDFFTDIINRLYAMNRTDILPDFKNLVKRLFPGGQGISAFERQKRAEASVRTIYIHAHMDEDTFDCHRAALCPDLVPSEPGKLIPACTYNLFYRKKDERFHV